MTDYRKLIVPGFIVSAGVNLFLLGMMSGTLVGGGPRHGFMPPPHDGPPNPGRMMEDLARQLPGEDGRKLTSIYREEAKDMDQRQDQIGSAIREVVAALRTEPLNDTVLKAALEKVATANETVHESIGVVLLRAAHELSPDGRHKLADLLERGPDRNFGPNDNARGPQDGPRNRPMRDDRPQDEMRHDEMRDGSMRGNPGRDRPPFDQPPFAQDDAPPEPDIIPSPPAEPAQTAPAATP